MIGTERLLRDRNRLRFAWEQRKQISRYQSIVIELRETRIEELEDKVSQLEVMLANYHRDNCER